MSGESWRVSWRPLSPYFCARKALRMPLQRFGRRAGRQSPGSGAQTPREVRVAPDQPRARAVGGQEMPDLSSS